MAFLIQPVRVFLKETKNEVKIGKRIFSSTYKVVNPEAIKSYVWLAKD